MGPVLEAPVASSLVVSTLPGYSAFSGDGGQLAHSLSPFTLSQAWALRGLLPSLLASIWPLLIHPAPGQDTPSQNGDLGFQGLLET